MCAVNLKLVNKLDLTWKQSFLILVDSKIFGRRSLYQFESTFLKRFQTYKHATSSRSFYLK
jgi:hypothetical protein